MKKKQKNKYVPLVRIVSLGCPKNFVDTEQAAASLLMHGFGIAASDEEADIFFINTCAFLQASREEAARVIHAAEEWKKEKSGRLIIGAGCLVGWDKDGSYRKKHFSSVDAWIPLFSNHLLGDVIAGAVEGIRKKIVPAPTLDGVRYPMTPGHYAWLRVADGCDNCCTYCLIPSIRGGLRSRKIEDVVAEADNLLESGVQELLVIAQDTAAYGRDFAGRSVLAELLKELDKLEGDFLLRLMYLHPASVTPELVETMCSARHLVKCLEMPIQHIADSVLKRMNRHIDEAAQRKLILRLRECGFALRTTLITGFPGETEEDFRNLYEFVKETRFERLGVFAWSGEEGTPAAEMKDLFIPAEVREERRDKIMRLQKQISKENNFDLVGEEFTAIVDEIHGEGYGRGRMLTDIPEIDNSVILNNLPANTCEGDRIPVRAESAGAYEIQASAVRRKHKNKEKHS